MTKRAAGNRRALYAFPEGVKPIYNDMPPPGYAAEFIFPFAGSKQSVLGSVRSEEDYGVTRHRS